MTVQNQNVKNVYRGNGSTTEFPFTFAINADHPEYIHVYITNDGEQAAETTDFACDMNARTVTYPKPGSSAPELSATQRLTIYRKLPYTQELNLVNQGPFFSEDVEQTFDDQEMQIQQLNEEKERSLRVGLETTNFDTVIPLAAGKTFRVKDDGTGFEVTDDPKAAREAAEAAQAAAEEAQGKAEDAQEAAERAQEDAEDAKDDAVDAKEAAEDIASQIDIMARALVYDNVAAMKADTTLEVGQTTATKGYYSVNDGGASVYTIRAKDVADVDDGGSIIFLDNDNVAELIADDSVDVLQFGAICDGNADDAVAFQNCVNYAASFYGTVTINKTIRLNATITVPSRVNIVATKYNEFYPKIVAGSACTLLFDCVGVQNYFENLHIMNYTNGVRVYRAYTAFDLHGNEIYDVDSYFYGCHIGYAEKCVIVRGRNVKFFDCGFSHSKYGVYYDFPAGATQLRGCEIEGCRFHGIGEEDALKFVDCAGIYIQTTASSNLTVRNCICDQGGTFIEGFARTVLIENNFVESFGSPLLKIENTGTTSNSDSMQIVGNVFKGRIGTTSYGESVNYPDNLVSITNAEGVLFSNNCLVNSYKQAILLDSVVRSSFSENLFTNISNSSTYRYAFDIKSCTNVYIHNNTNSSSAGLYLCKGDLSYPSTVDIRNNIKFSNPSNIALTGGKNYYQLYSGTSGAETTLTPSDIPQGYFFVRRNDNATVWFMVKIGNYISSPAFMAGNSDTVDFLYHTIDPDTEKITFKIKRLTTATNTWSTINVDIAVGVLL